MNSIEVIHNMNKFLRDSIAKNNEDIESKVRNDSGTIDVVDKGVLLGKNMALLEALKHLLELEIQMAQYFRKEMESIGRNIDEEKAKAESESN